MGLVLEDWLGLVLLALIAAGGLVEGLDERTPKKWWDLSPRNQRWWALPHNLGLWVLCAFQAILVYSGYSLFG
jgi:hypothetical protein